VHGQHRAAGRDRRARDRPSQLRLGATLPPDGKAIPETRPGGGNHFPQARSYAPGVGWMWDGRQGGRHGRGGPCDGFTFNGLGTTLYGERDFDLDGSYLAKERLVFAYVPIVPQRSFRILPTGKETRVFVRDCTVCSTVDRALHLERH
jgi:hypothetical protein